MTSGSPTLWVPVGFGQTRTAKQLPVLTMVAAYSRTLFARLIPFRTAAGFVLRLVGASAAVGWGATRPGVGR